MTLRRTNLDEIEERHLEALVADAVPESGSIEYKRDLPGGSDSEGKEFLADVCSFANSGGGDIVYGIEEQKGAAVAVRGMPVPDPDALILRLESMVLGGLSPRLGGGFGSRPVPLRDGNYALVMRVPEVTDGPCAVNYKGRFGYYSRGTAGKYLMDPMEVKRAILGAGSLDEKIRTFREERLDKVRAGETPSPLVVPRTGVLALHLVPDSSFEEPPPRVDLDLADGRWDLLVPVGGLTGGVPRRHFDGLLRETTLEGEKLAYALLFRNGTIETANTDALGDRREREPRLSIPGSAFERWVIHALTGHLALLEALGVPPPATATLSLLGVRGYTMLHGPRDYDPDDGVPIDRNELLIPGVVFDGFRGQDRRAVAARMRPVFDAVCNACGLSVVLVGTSSVARGRQLSVHGAEALE